MECYLDVKVNCPQGISDVGRKEAPSPPPGTLTAADKEIARQGQQRQSSRVSLAGSHDGEFIPEDDDDSASRWWANSPSSNTSVWLVVVRSGD
mgnify:CR=1 FL=1